MRKWPVNPLLVQPCKADALCSPTNRIPTPREFGIDYEDLMIPCKDGVRINAWLMKQKDHNIRPTLIFFHGNAGSESVASFSNVLLLCSDF